MKKIFNILILLTGISFGSSLPTLGENRFQDILREGASVESLVEAIHHLAYSGNKAYFWDYVKYLDFNSGEETGGSDSAMLVRKAAAEALGRLKDERAVKFLLDRYKKEKKATVKASIMYALGFYQNAESLSVIEESLASENDDLRYHAMMASVTLNKKETAAKIRSLLASEKDEAMRITISYALISLGDDVAVNRKVLIAGLINKDPVVRFRSADYLARLKDISSLGAIIKAADIENRWWVKIELDRSINILYEEKRKKTEMAESAVWNIDPPSRPVVETQKNDTMKVPENKTPAAKDSKPAR